MVDLFIVGSGPQAALLAERVTWRLGEEGDRPVVIWGDTRARPAEQEGGLRPVGAEETPAYEAAIAASLRKQTETPDGEEIPADEWLLLEPLLQQLVQGGDLQSAVRVNPVASLPLKVRVKRSWDRFLMRNPDEENPFKQPPGSEMGLVGGWGRLLDRLEEKHRQLRQEVVLLSEVTPIPPSHEEPGGWSGIILLPTGEATEIRTQNLVLVGEQAETFAEQRGEEGLFRWSLPAGDRWGGDRFYRLIRDGERIAERVISRL